VPFSPASRVAQVGFHLRWQWPAVSMQYERLMERSRLPMERVLAEHMRTIADMDFLVTAVRRLLRTAELALPIRSEHRPQLKLALTAFNSRWRESLKSIRNALEHLDASGDFPVPSVGIPTSGNGEGSFTFAGVHGNLDLGKLYEDAQSVAAAIAKVIESAEAEQEKATVSRPGQRD
jgi:hypothetical protein